MMAFCSPVYGAVAQLEERLHGMQEVVGSIPIGSTKLDFRSGRGRANLNGSKPHTGGSTTFSAVAVLTMRLEKV